MSNIKVSVLGAVHMKGISNKGAGAPYDFATVSYFVDSQSLTTDYMKRTVAGREVATVNTSREVVDKLASLNFPVDLELILSPDPTNIQRNIVTDFSLAEPPKIHDPLKKFIKKLKDAYFSALPPLSQGSSALPCFSLGFFQDEEIKTCLSDYEEQFSYIGSAIIVLAFLVAIAISLGV